MTHEEALIRAFIVWTKREQYARRLSGGKRTAFINRRFGGASRDLDPRFARRLESHEQKIDHVHALLQAKGAPEICYVVGHSVFDGQEVGLTEALEENLGSSVGVFISCVPGRLAYFEGEHVGERYLLER